MFFNPSEIYLSKDYGNSPTSNLFYHAEGFHEIPHGLHL